MIKILVTQNVKKYMFVVTTLLPVGVVKKIANIATCQIFCDFPFPWYQRTSVVRRSINTTRRSKIIIEFDENFDDRVILSDRRIKTFDTVT